MSNIIKIAWNEVDWKKIESRVFRVQRRIYKAKIDKKITAVHYLQKKIIIGFEEKLLSIREATRVQQLYWIKKIHINNSRKQINLIYNSRVEKNIIFDKNKVKNLKKILIDSETKTNELIKDKAKQYLIKLALEPEWASKFEPYSMGHNLGQSYYDTLTNIWSRESLNKEYSFQKNVSEDFKSFNSKRFLKKLNTIKIIKIQIENWLQSSIFEKRNLPFYTEFKYEKSQKNIIIPLLFDIAFNGLETYLTNFLTSTIKNSKKDVKIKYCRYLDNVIILSTDLILINEISIIYNKYLHKLGSNNNNEKSKISKNTEGITFLGFQLILIKRKNHFQQKLFISKESKKFLLAKTRFIIQKNKSVSSYYLVKKLIPSIVIWGKYFQYCECRKDFLQIDNRILNQLRAWVFRRKAAGKNRTFLKEKYFPNNAIFTYEKLKYKENWVLSGELKVPNKDNLHIFLPKLSWIKQKNYVAVKNNNCIYNGDYLYWSRRLNNVEEHQHKLLQKKFLVEGKIEIYNFLVKSKQNLLIK